MILLAGTIRITPGKRDAALPHIRAIVAASRAEPGCLDYSFAFDVNDDHLVHIFEVFRDLEAREAHRHMPHMQLWRDSWAEAGIGDRNMREFEIASAKDI
ncbi:MAG: putative quinol monooxygenase [Alphaproteobacteria bacterium]|nr:putative quinol monooxygenase [Alphaproteobacteria bacterium]